MLTLDTFQAYPTSVLSEPPALTLRLSYNSDFLDVNNNYVLGASKNFYIEFPCSVTANVITVAATDVFTTLDANVQNPQSINCTAQFFSGNSGKDFLFSQWVIPSEAEYPGGVITFAQLTIYNTGANTLANPPSTFLTTAETVAYFSTLSPAPNATMLVKGIGAVSYPPVSASFPIFLGQNDPAIAGSDSVSTANSRVGSNSVNISVADSKAVSDSVVMSSLTTTTNSKVISTSLNVSVADSKGVSAGTRASVADSKAVSDSVLASTADSKGVSSGLAASSANSTAVSVGTLTSTADSKGVSSGTQASAADSKALSDSVVTSTLTTTTNSAVTSLALKLSTTTSTANSG